MDGSVVLDDVWDKHLIDWLPSGLVKDIKANEEPRFVRLVRSVQEVARSIPNAAFADANPQLIIDSAAWLPQIDTYMKCRNWFSLSLVADLYHAALHIGLACTALATMQVRWLNMAGSILTTYGADLALAGLTLDWRLYWDSFHEHMRRAERVRIDGGFSCQVFLELHVVCKQARLLFTADAAAGLWECLLPALSQPMCSASLDAMLLLLTFFPHQAVSRDRDAPWAAWADRALELWASVRHNTYWDRCWLCFFSRLAKWDTFDVIDWERVLARVSTTALWLFHVPVGASSGSCGRNIAPSEMLMASIAGATTNEASTCHDYLAKILMYTLRPGASDAPRQPGGLTALAALKSFAMLLEHYFHASNSGKWSRELADFLESCSYQLITRRLTREAAAWWRGAAAVRLDPRTLQPVAAVLHGLASVAVFHKSEDLLVAALDVLSNTAYLQPGITLPFIWARFLEAMSASDAVHQLAHSIRLLAECVRPMLLHGLPADGSAADGDAPMDGTADAVTAQESAGLALGRAMVALLPALDANDEAKLQASIAFYLAVFSNCVAVAGADAPRAPGAAAIDLGVYLEDWAVQFLDRLFGAIDTLHSEGELHAVDDSRNSIPVGSWLGSYYKLLGLLAQFFRKLPPGVAVAAFMRLAKHVTHLVEPRKAEDLAHFVARGSAALPALAAQHVLHPLLSKLVEDAAVVQDEGSLTQVFVASMVARLSVLHSVLHGLGTVHALAEHARPVFALLSRTANASSPAILENSMRLFEVLLHCLGAQYVLHDCAPLAGVPGSINGAVAAWIAKTPSPDAAAGSVLWFLPTAAEVALARSLAEEAVAHAAAEISAMVADGSITDSSAAPRRRLRRAQSLLSAVVSGLMAAMPSMHLSEEAAASRRDEGIGAALGICALDSPGWEGCNVLIDAVHAQINVVLNTDSANTWSLKNAIDLLDRVNGVVYFYEASVSGIADELNTNDRTYTEPPIADLLLGLPVGARGAGIRHAPWCVTHRVSQALSVRRSLLPFNAWATTTRPGLQAAELHPSLLRGLALLSRLALHRYADVSGAAGEVLSVNYLAWVPELRVLTFPGVSAALGLVQQSPGCGMPPQVLGGAAGAAEAAVDERVQDGHALPHSRAEVHAMLQKQVDALMAVVAQDWTRPDDFPTADLLDRLQFLERGALVEQGADRLSGDPCDDASADTPRGGGTPLQLRDDGLSRLSTDFATAGVSPPHSRGAGAGAGRRVLIGPAGVRPDSVALDALAITGLHAHGSRAALDKHVHALLAQGADAGSPTLAPTDVAGLAPRTVFAGSRSESAAGARASAAGRDGECTEANKHVVMGAVAVLDSIGDLLPRAMAEEPLIFKALFLNYMVMQRYDHIEVKSCVNPIISSMYALLARLPSSSPPPGPPLPINAALMRDVALLLCKQLASGALHWRQSVLAHVLFAHLVPISGADSHLLREMLRLQLNDAIKGDVLLVKDSALTGLVNTLAAAAHPDCDAAFRATVTEAIAAEAGRPDWGAQLVATLLAMHAVDDLDRFRSLLNYEAAPEQSIVMLVAAHTSVLTHRDGQPFLHRVPSLRAADRGDADRGDRGACVTLLMAKVVEYVARFAPGAAAAALQEPLLAWHTAGVTEQDREPHMELVAMEAALGALASGDAHAAVESSSAAAASTSDGTRRACAWDAWLRELVEARYASANAEKGAMWAHVLALALRILANDVAGATATWLHAAVVPRAQLATFDSLLAFVCDLTERTWSGNSVADGKHACLLIHALELLLQLQSKHPHEAVAAGLRRLADASLIMLTRINAHPLQSVRVVGAKLARMLLCVLRSPVPALPAADRVEADPASLSGRLLRALTDAEAAASAALTASHAACDAEAPLDDVEGRANEDAAPSTVVTRRDAAWEASIGYMVAIVSTFSSATVQHGAVKDVVAGSLPWVLRVQALRYPALQGLMPPIRKLRKIYACEGAAVPRVLAMLVDGVAADAWQVRVSAISLLQVFWFRNFFAISGDDIAALVALSQRCLRDDKVEIRDVAAATLSGLLKCSPASAVQAFRHAVMAEAARLFPFKRKRGAGAASLPEHHACVLALQALLLSSPYAIQEWMSDLLLAITRAVRVPAPVKSAAVAALGEFRKTHELTSSVPLRDRLREDVYDSIRDAAFQSSYFV